MTEPTPLLDSRDAATLRANLVSELHKHVAGWSETDVDGRPDQASAALIGVFTHFCEVVIQRFNRVPDKNFLAFLDLLGLSRLPPQPARVPLTFGLATGSRADGVVPPGTQVAAPPGEGEKEPVIFETERELTVVAATLQTLLTVDANRGVLADHGALLTQPSVAGTRILAGDRVVEHLLYIGHATYFLDPDLRRPEVALNKHEPPFEEVIEIRSRHLQWEAWNGTAWQVLGDDQVLRPGFFMHGVYHFANLPKMPLLTIAGIESRWLRCRLLLPLSTSLLPAAGTASAGLLPLFESMTVRPSGSGTLSPDVALVNNAPLDITRPFYPFGDKPRIGDAFYLGSHVGFGQTGASAAFDVPLVNPTPAVLPAPPVVPPVTNPSPDLRLRWEIWTATGWSALGESTPTTSSPFSDGFADGTHAFTKNDEPLRFTVPDTIVTATFGGVTTYWLRALIIGGNYGVDARYSLDANAPGGFKLDPATFGPPVVSQLTLTYQSEQPPAPADAVAYNNFDFENLAPAMANGDPVAPFRPLPVRPPTFYLPFALPATRTAFPNRPISLYFGLRTLQYGEQLTPLHPDLSIQSVPIDAPATIVSHRFTLTNTTRDRVSYHIEAGGEWACSVSLTDVTLEGGESREIVLDISVPSAEPGIGGRGTDPIADVGYLWLHSSADNALYSARFETRVGAIPARKRAVQWEYWNGSVWQALRVVDGTERLTQPGIVEFLGPADIVAASHFGVSGYWLRAVCEPGDDPVEPRLRVLAPNTTFAAQTVTVRNELLGSSDTSTNQRFTTVRAPVLAGPQLEVRENDAWVLWAEVPDLYASAPEDRHYVLDHVTGQVIFGNGVQGRIPPRGVGNVRMTRYQTGGGSAGNRAAGTIVQMKTTVPYIGTVTNPEAAAGGFGTESNDAMIERAPRTLRHGDRAVAADDYEDLARLASPEVARAKCVPLHLLQKDPLGQVRVPGAASVIVVPGTADPKPLPSTELLRNVGDFLRARQIATAEVAVVGPLYVRVDVEVEVVLASLQGSSQVAQEIRDRLAAFLHPLTGGRDGTGWDFGREPHVSDLYAVVGDVPDVDYIRHLELAKIADVEGAADTGRFLVYSGRHQITLTFAGAQ